MNRLHERKSKVRQKKQSSAQDQDESISLSPPLLQLKSNGKNNASAEQNVTQKKSNESYQFQSDKGGHGDGCDCDGCSPSQMKINPYQLKNNKSKNEIQLKSGPYKEEKTTENAQKDRLPEDVQQKMETSFNTDFSDINIYSNSTKAENMGALAYTKGSDVHFAPGQYSPNSQSGQELIGHELTHTVQQKEGRVQATTQKKGVAVNEDSSLENEADVSGKQAAQGKAVQKKSSNKGKAGNNNISQFKGGHDGGCGCDDCSGVQMKENPIQKKGLWDWAGDMVDSAAEGIKSAGEKISNTVEDAITDLTELTSPRKAFVRSRKTELRSDPPDLKKTGKKLENGTQVYIVKTVKKKKKTYALIDEHLPSSMMGPTQRYGWMPMSNLVEFHTKKKFKLESGTQKFVNKVLKKAGKDPEKWFKDFKHITFLGRHTETPIHQELVYHLKRVERNLVQKFGDGTGDPWVAGNNLGLSPKVEGIKGARRKATSSARSMHFFGLAIDMEYSQNPYINEKKEDRDVIASVFPNATRLITGKKQRFVSDEESTDYDKILKLDKILEEYFGLLDDPKKLKSKLDDAKTKGTTFWKSKTEKQAKAQIKSDLDDVSTEWSRRKKTIKSGGFTNFKKELVHGMGLHWGGTYGDMMHFDMRNSGSGIAIHKWRKKF